MSLFTSPVIGQVTIGSAHAPADGSILDLKENEDGTSTRGLGLPRVQLGKPSVLLVADEAEKEGHAGLLVYHVKSDECAYQMATGLYVWSGNLWNPLSNVSDPLDNSIVQISLNGSSITSGGEHSAQVGDVINFSVKAVGSKKWTWKHNGTSVSNSQDFQVNIANDSNFGEYVVEVDDGCDNILSSFINIIAGQCVAEKPYAGKMNVTTLGSTGSTTVVTPNGSEVSLGGKDLVNGFKLIAGASGDVAENLTVWEKDGVRVSTGSLTYQPQFGSSGVTEAHVGTYVCKIYNKCNEIIEVLPAVKIAIEDCNLPAGGKIALKIPSVPGSNFDVTNTTFRLGSPGYFFTLTASATIGGTGLKYQWLKDGSAIAGATSATYTRSFGAKITEADLGRYSCIISNDCGDIENIPYVDIAMDPAMINCTSNTPVNDNIIDPFFFRVYQRENQVPVKTAGGPPSTSSYYKITVNVDLINQIKVYAPIAYPHGVLKYDWYKIVGGNRVSINDYNGLPSSPGSDQLVIERNGPGSVQGLYELVVYDTCYMPVNTFKLQFELVEVP